MGAYHKSLEKMDLVGLNGQFMAFSEDTSRYREFKLGDLVYYHETYVIPPDAVNWKLSKPDKSDNIAIIVYEDEPQWDLKPHPKHRLFRIKHLKSGIVRTCSSHNLTKAYISEEIRESYD